MNRSETVGALAKALAEFQAECPAIPKTRTAKIPGKGDKAGYSYKYADLSDILSAVGGLLASKGLSVSSNVGSDGQYVIASAVLLHESGEWMETDAFMLPAGNTPQTAGSAATYGRRYTVSAVLGITSEEDDDGAAATHSADAGVPASPRATEKAVKAIWAKSKAVGWDHDTLVANLVKRYGDGAHPDTLTKEQASHVLDGLTKLEAQLKEEAVIAELGAEVTS